MTDRENPWKSIATRLLHEINGGYAVAHDGMTKCIACDAIGCTESIYNKARKLVHKPDCPVADAERLLQEPRAP